MKFKCFSILISALFSCSYLYAAGNFAVGTLQGEFNVSPTGAATYEIPIECPTGIGGLKPELKFVYNSQLGEGLMGCGWTIGGLSAITRVPKTKYHDGKVASVEYTIDDALALDGARLVKVSSDGGSAEFRTERDIYTRIVGYEPTQYGYKYFKATMKDGRTFTFASPDSDGGSFGWPLTEICDANGNYITFQNITSYGGDMNFGIGRVIYGKNKSGAGFETVIEFEFETSPNPVTQYVGGKAVDKWARLGKVRVLGNGFVKTGEYALTYNDGKIFSDRSRLSSISYSRDGVSLGSTNFTWTNNNYCIKSVKDPDLGVIGFWNDFYSFTLGDGKGSGTTDMAYIVKGSPLIICNGLSYDNTIKLNHYNYDNVLFYDVDNDGVQELVTGQSSFMGLQRRIFHSVGKWDGKSQMYVWKVQDKQTLFPSSDADTYSPEDYRVSEIAGDFYGDGNLQYVPMYKKFDIRSASIWKQLLSVTSTDNDNRYGNICKRATGDFPDLRNVSEDPCLAYAVNMNGNAKSDLMCVFKSGAIKFYEENNGVFEEIMKNNLTLGKDDAIYPADFNGDGNTDLIIIRGGTALRAEVYLSTGKDFKLSEIGNTLHLGNSDVLGIIDINSDGRSDVVVSNPNECTLYFSNGHNFIKMVSVPNKTLNPDSSEARRISKFLPALSRIYDGKGGMHFLEYFEGIVEFSPNDILDKVVKIEDGLHNTINIGYDKIDNFVKPAQASFVPGLYKDVVSTVSRLNSSGKGANLKYEYGDVLYDKDARSFMGYGMVKNTDVNTSRETVSRYSLKNSCVLCDSKVESVNGRIIKSLNNRCDILTNKDGKIHMALLTSQTEIDKLTGAELYTECKNLDAYGNPQKILIKRVGQIVTHEISYVRLLGDKVSKPVSIKTTYSYGGRSETRERSMSYDDNGNITSDTENGIVRRYMDYDVFGNYQTLQYGDGADMRTEKYVYTPSGRHIWNKTNALGEKTVYRWGEVKDRLESEIDAYKRITYYYYDAFGNLTGTYKGSNITSIEKQWAEQGNQYGASYYTLERNYKDPDVTTWYTSDGLEVCREQYGLNGKKVYVVKEYNNDGTVSRVSMPSYESVPSAWAEQYTYDSFGRPVKILTAEGEMQLSYSGFSTTMTLNGDKVVKVMTPEGWVGYVTTNGKKVKYTYYPTGEMKTATPDGGEPVYMEYDKQGNRTLISEADGGTVKRTFNAFGELTKKSQKQGNGVLVNTDYTYSPEGLLMQMNCGGMVTNYMYDSQNRLISKTMAGGISQSYEYDKYDRILKTVDKIDGKEFVRSTTYDGDGRKKRETYPSGYYIENVYDENGVLALVKDMNGSEIYKPLDADASGHILKECRGGRVTAYTFDAAGRMTSKMSDGMINHSYTYDAKGNLTQFIDNLSHQSCHYGYDELNRLAEWQAYGADVANPIFTDKIAYDGSNNMVSRSSLGDVLLAYDNASHPHAVSSISGVPNGMSKDDHNITYTNFGKVESVSQGDRRYDITYSANEDRIKTEYTTEKGKTTRYYAGDYEEVTDPQGNVTKFCYLPGGAMMVEKGGEQKLYYNYTDRLGSIIATADADGNVIERYAYDPWGTRLNPENWAEKDKREQLFNNRGFTGHEHIDGLDLINMNGRMYDSMLGMFLSVDPLIQTPSFWLNYNRYLYGYGNPLKYVDPSGKSIIVAIVIGAIVGAVVGGVVGYMYGYIQGAKGWDLFKYTLVGVGVGAVVGAICGAGGYGLSIVASKLIALAGTLTITNALTFCAVTSSVILGLTLTAGGCALDIYLTDLLGGLWVGEIPNNTSNKSQGNKDSKETKK